VTTLGYFFYKVRYIERVIKGLSFYIAGDLMQTYKVRKLSSAHGKDWFGVTIPISIIEKWKDTFVTIEESGNNLILGSVAVG